MTELPPEMRPGRLLATYNRETARVGRPALRLGRGPSRTRVGLEALGRFCHRHGVDPVRWIRARHEAVSWRHRLLPRQLPSEKFLEAFTRFGDDRQAARQGDEALALACVDDIDLSGPELAPHAEFVKAALADDRPTCRASAPSITLGWNPRSEHCAPCPEAAPCRADLSEATRRARS